MPYRVTMTTPYWHLNGVNTVSASLARGLGDLDVESEILLTDSKPRGLDVFPPPADVTFRQLAKRRKIRPQLEKLAADLSAGEQCVYLPGYDYRLSGVAPVLPNKVIAVGVLHGDDPMHFDHVKRLGKYWNAIVCVSHLIEKCVCERFPDLIERTSTIPNGVELPETCPKKACVDGAPLKLAWAGRVVQEGKRVMDLPILLDELHALKANATLTVAGDGPCLEKLRSEAAAHIAAGRLILLGAVSNREVHQLFEKADAFLLTSDSNEGLPISMLEAMARGCVPIVTDIESGVPEVVRHDQNGLILPAGDMERFALSIHGLSQDQTRIVRLREQATRTISDGGFNTKEMSRCYKVLFDHLTEEANRGRFIRPQGELQLPWIPSLRDRLSMAFRAVFPRTGDTN